MSGTAAHFLGHLVRANWNASLEERVRRPDPQARLIVEACAATRDALKQKYDDWADADALTGLRRLDNGGITLSSATADIIEHASSDGYRSALDARVSPVDVAKIVWAGTDARDVEIYDVRAYLHPKVDGGSAKTVAFWECHLYAGLGGATGLVLKELCDPEAMVATGTSAGDITFDFSGRDVRPMPKKFPNDTEDGIPVLYIEIRAVDAEGGVADNVGWGRDSTTVSVTTASNVLTGRTLTRVTTGADPIYTDADTTQTPRCRVRTSTKAEATITFGTNPMDLGGVPTGTVEFWGQGDTPNGSVITYQVRNNGDTDWITFTDGQTSDEVGVSKRQTYKMQATLTPDATTEVTPVLRVLGVREVTLQQFDGLAVATGGQGDCDPVTLKCSIPEIKITVVRDGVSDYFDAISDLLSSTYPVNLEWRVWCGHPDLARANWLLIDTYRHDDHVVRGGAMEITALSVLADLKGALPAYDEAGDQRASLAYAEQTLKAVTEAIRDDEISLPSRFVGPSIEDAVTRVSKTITSSDGKLELDALAYLAGGTWISSQGRLKYTDIFGDKASILSVPMEEVQWGDVGPGLGNRVPEFFVPYDFDFSNYSGQAQQNVDPGKVARSQHYNREVRSFHADALANIGRARLGDPPILDDMVAQWIHSVNIGSMTRAGTTVTVDVNTDHGVVVGQIVTIIGAVQTDYNGDQTVATVTDTNSFTFETAATPTSPAVGALTVAILPHVIGNRTVRALGAGVMLLQATLRYAHPEVEIGDMLTAQTDRIVMRDPNVARAIRGRLWVRGVVTGIHDLWGQQVSLLVRSPADITASPVGGTRDTSNLPAVCSVYRTSDQTMSVPATTSVLWTTDLVDREGMHDTGSNTERITITKPGTYKVTWRCLWDTGSGAGSLLLERGGSSGGLQIAFYDDFAGGAGTISATGEALIEVTLDAVTGDYFYAAVQVDAGGSFHMKGGAQSSSSFTVTQVSPL